MANENDDEITRAFWANLVKDEISGQQQRFLNTHALRLTAARRFAERCQSVVLANRGFVILDPTVPRSPSPFCLPCLDLDPFAGCLLCPLSPFFNGSNIETARVLSSHLDGVRPFKAFLGDVSADRRYQQLMNECAMIIEDGIIQGVGPLDPSDYASVPLPTLSPPRAEHGVAGQAPRSRKLTVRRGRGT